MTKRGGIGTPEAELSVFVSPLVSLMVDQVSNLYSRGVFDAILSGNSGVNEKYLVKRHKDWPVLLPSLLVRGENIKVFR